MKKISKILLLFTTIYSFNLNNITPNSYQQQIYQPASSLFSSGFLDKNFGNNKILFTSGTGFYISKNYIVTNHHVVDNCQGIQIRGEIVPNFAKIYAVDKNNDLAILETPVNPEFTAELNDNDEVNIGDNVTVIGYPLQYGIRGKQLVKNASITNNNDEYNGQKRIQFTDAIEEGNSGGPLLDDNGKVIGVVAGKMSFYLANSYDQDSQNAKPIKTVSVAISLSTLKEFLQKYRIIYKNYNLADNDLANNASLKRKSDLAKKYIVNIHCMK